jgi:hypothetical protein
MVRNQRCHSLFHVFDTDTPLVTKVYIDLLRRITGKMCPETQGGSIDNGACATVGLFELVKTHRDFFVCNRITLRRRNNGQTRVLHEAYAPKSCSSETKA